MSSKNDKIVILEVLCSEFGVSKVDERLLLNEFQNVESGIDRYADSLPSDRYLIAAFFYHKFKDMNDKITQSAVSEVVGCTEVTLRKYIKGVRIA